MLSPYYLSISHTHTNTAVPFMSWLIGLLPIVSCTGILRRRGRGPPLFNWGGLHIQIKHNLRFQQCFLKLIFIPYEHQINTLLPFQLKWSKGLNSPTFGSAKKKLSHSSCATLSVLSYEIPFEICFMGNSVCTLTSGYR